MVVGSLGEREVLLRLANTSASKRACLGLFRLIKGNGGGVGSALPFFTLPSNLRPTRPVSRDVYDIARLDFFSWAGLLRREPLKAPLCLALVLKSTASCGG